MQRSETKIQHALEPSQPLGHYAHLALEKGVRFALALMAGLLAARALRGRRTHWSWAALVGALVLMVRGPLGETASLFELAALSATIRGRRWHREDLHSGGDLARLARGRLSPAVRVAGLVSRLWRTWGNSVGSSAGRHRAQMLLGCERGGRSVLVPFGAATGRHTLIVGATGSGKTVTQTLMAVRAIERGLGAIVLDPKGDRGMRERLRAAATAANRDFLEWSPSGPTVYNPYAHGGETEIVDRTLAGERFSEPHYLRQAQRYLGHAVRALSMAGVEVSLQTIVAHLDPATLEVLLRGLEELRVESSHAYLDSLTARQLRDLAGVRDRLAILAESDVGRWLDPLTEGVRRFDLLQAVGSRAVVYFNLESDSRPLLSQMLGAAIVQDLQSAVAALQGSPTSTLVVIDEFSAIAAEHVVALFGRARSAGFNLLLGTQELSDLRLPGHERLLEQVLGNLSLLIAHRQVVPSSAELIAQIAGSRGSWRVSWGSDGRTTRTRTSEPSLAPEHLTALAPGWAAVMTLGHGERVRITRVASVGGAS